MKNVPLTRPFLDESEIEMVRRCLASGWVTQGPMVTQFERRFAEIHSVKYALATTSCTAALHLATMAAGLCPGDEAIVPAYTWVTSANCIEYTGARAIFADVDLNTYNIDPDNLESAITTKTKAVIVVHLFGLSAEMDRIMHIARKYNLKVIEDAACAVGCKYDGKPVGGIGDIGCFSFHPRKVVTTGEGGMVTTNKTAYAELIGSLRNHGTVGGEPGPGAMPNPHAMSRVVNLGYNLRLSDILGAVGLAQLSKLEGLLKERKLWAEKYDAVLKDIDEIIIPYVPEKTGHTYQSYVVRLRIGGKEVRNKIMDYLAAHGISTRPGTHAVHRLEFYRNKYNLQPDQFPNSVKGEDETITLPLYHGINEDDQDYVVRKLKEAISNSLP